VHFVFVGEGPLNPRIWNVANVVVREPVSHADLARYYRASDLLLLPAVGEGLPLVVQEALCSGVPPLVSREVIEACPEMAPFAYDAGVGGDQLSSVFAAFLARPEPCERAHERAAFARSLWSWERCGDAYAEIFRSLGT
jgi:glycosyltransferase involved in cell wall biosynthesis